VADAQRHGGAFREVDAAHAMRRFAVVYPHHHGAAGCFVHHPHDGAERDEAVRRGHAHGVIALAAGGDVG